MRGPRRWLAAGMLAVVAGCATPPDRSGVDAEHGGVTATPARPASPAMPAMPAPAAPHTPAAAEESPALELQRGKASWYGARFHGRRTASGERFDMNDLTAAHPSLPFGTRVLVRNISNGLEVVVRINDRGPHVKRRIIDLSKAAAEALGLVQAGEAPVVVFGL